MKISLILAASALAVGLSGAALAANTTTTKSTTTKATTTTTMTTKHVVHHHHPKLKPAPVTACTTLERQFAWEAPHHTKALWYQSAQWFAARGTKFCGEGSTFRGEWDLRVALDKIGVTPKA